LGISEILKASSKIVVLIGCEVLRFKGKTSVCHVRGIDGANILIPHRPLAGFATECQSHQRDLHRLRLAGFAPKSLADFAPKRVAGFRPKRLAGFAPKYSAGNASDHLRLLLSVFTLDGFSLLGQVVEQEDPVVQVDLGQPHGSMKVWHNVCTPGYISPPPTLFSSETIPSSSWYIPTRVFR